jgi:hypothetical protein
MLDRLHKLDYAAMDYNEDYSLIRVDPLDIPS